VVFLRGLAWAVEQGFDVINLSLGTSKRDWALAFYEICDEAYFRNCLLVTAANNIQRPSFPSMYGAVASVACNLSTHPLRFHYNPEPPTEFLARGIDVEVPWLDHEWIRSTGNSYAAPHIAGFAALIRSKHPELRPFQVKTVLWATAANVREAPVMAGRLSRVIRSTTASSRATAALRRSGA
jgi:subtilisin family serine protease